jgi:hypothetical protein
MVGTGCLVRLLVGVVLVVLHLLIPPPPPPVTQTPPPPRPTLVSSGELDFIYKCYLYFHRGAIGGSSPVIPCHIAVRSPELPGVGLGGVGACVGECHGPPGKEG